MSGAPRGDATVIAPPQPTSHMVSATELGAEARVYLPYSRRQCVNSKPNVGEAKSCRRVELTNKAIAIRSSYRLAVHFIFVVCMALHPKVE